MSVSSLLLSANVTAAAAVAANVVAATSSSDTTPNDDGWLLSSCSDGCGWAAAILGACFYGTYGVPIKDTKHIPVHPLVLQSFKTATFFIMCWLVLLLDVKAQWTAWGLLSGLLWVLGGMCGIYAIRMAGLAIAVGTWSSVMCFINFIWGILIFQEPVADFWATTAAFGLLGLGLVGMSHFSAPRFNKRNHQNNNNNHNGDNHDNDDETRLTKVESTDSDEPGHCMDSNNHHNDNGLELAAPLLISSSSSHENHPASVITSRGGETSTQQQQQLQQQQHQDDAALDATETAMSTSSGASDDTNKPSSSFLGTFLSETKDGQVILLQYQPLEHHHNSSKRQVLVPKSMANGTSSNSPTIATTTTLAVTKRTAGILAAVANGILAGSSLIPVHYAKEQGLGGAHYIISFATGATIANIFVWMALIWIRYQNSLAFTIHHLLPTGRHLRELFGRALMAGVLLSFGMFFSILSVTYLGQGIGNSVVQSKMLISGLWGILWFREVKGSRTIAYWLGSATVSICGILLLSHERLTAAVAAQAEKLN